MVGMYGQTDFMIAALMIPPSERFRPRLRQEIRLQLGKRGSIYSAHPMNASNIRPQSLEPGFLLETTGEGRLVVWLPEISDPNGLLWERVRSVARADMTTDDSVCSLAATGLPTRQRTVGFLGGLLGRIRGESANKTFALPDGRLVEPCGPRRADLVLAWTEDGSQFLDEERIRARWPECESVRRLGENLFVVYGVKPGEVRHPNTASSNSKEAASSPTPKKPAERSLEEAIRTGDRRREVIALSDLGFIALTENDAVGASVHLSKALAIARQFGDLPRVAELLGSLGLAQTYLGHNQRAIDLIEQGIAEARSAGDPFVEKTLLERRGQVELNLKRADLALGSFEQALALARKVCDHHQEGFLLWRIGSVHAERGDREKALARCSKAIEVFRRHGRPHAAWFAQHLDRFRNGFSVGIADPVTFVNEASNTQAVSSTAIVPSENGPGILRMAVSASQAMAKFVGSGMKSASPEIRDWRLSTCRGCEHHTGIRCRVCGCFTDVKTRLGGEACPIGKW